MADASNHVYTHTKYSEKNGKSRNSSHYSYSNKKSCGVCRLNNLFIFSLRFASIASRFSVGSRCCAAILFAFFGFQHFFFYFDVVALLHSIYNSPNFEWFCQTIRGRHTIQPTEKYQQINGSNLLRVFFFNKIYTKI